MTPETAETLTLNPSPTQAEIAASERMAAKVMPQMLRLTLAVETAASARMAAKIMPQMLRLTLAAETAASETEQSSSAQVYK